MAIVLEMLNHVGLKPGRFAEQAGNLSHGEHQLLELAVVLAANPRLILLDEPSAGMTHEEMRRMVRLVRDIARTATVIVVEHNMEFVRQLNALVTVLHQGKVFAKGSIEELRKNQDVVDIYLGRYEHAKG